MIKAVFWDNDGVLVDTERLYFKATQQVLSTVGIVLTKEFFVHFVLVKGTGVFHLAKEIGLSDEDIQQLRSNRNDLYSTLLQRECLVIDGVKNVLTLLRNKYVMGIVTSSRKDHFDRIHASSDILQFFDFILTGNDFKKFKPDPEPYLMALQKSGFKNTECIVIEDSERGLLSAKAAELQCIVIPNEMTRGSDFSKADKVVTNVREIPDALKLF